MAGAPTSVQVLGMTPAGIEAIVPSVGVRVVPWERTQFKMVPPDAPGGGGLFVTGHYFGTPLTMLVAEFGDDPGVLRTRYALTMSHWFAANAPGERMHVGARTVAGDVGTDDEDMAAVSDDTDDDDDDDESVSAAATSTQVRTCSRC